MKILFIMSAKLICTEVLRVYKPTIAASTLDRTLAWASLVRQIQSLALYDVWYVYVI